MPAGGPQIARRGTVVADLDRALARIAGHFDSAWIVDHLQSGDEDTLEGWTTLAYMAARHPRLQFGHSVICQSFRNPALLAKMGATLQLLTGGRFILGLGTGWNEEEYRAYGYPFPSNATRVDQLEETLQIVRALWTQDTATFAGQYYQVQEARCLPRPDPPPPILIGAFRPRMLRLTARYADEWNVSSTGPTAYTAMAAGFDRACAAEGRDPATVRRSWGGGIACAATESAARALAGDRFSTESEDDYGFVGTPAQILAQMQPFIALGITRFILDCQDFPDLTGLDLLIREVLPAVGVKREI
jgi:alkanesulfonate monooxygenase SsuD/methylene tetrahydromethanopterin reductase-like flavin-dependent oxidoreductase (luciferase family)